VLDYLVRHFILVEDYPPVSFPEPELILRQPGTVALASGDELPNCDLCREAERSTPARYDAAMRGRGSPWAFMCPDCFVMSGHPSLGLGRGQYLMTSEEISPKVREGFFRAREYWISLGAEPPPHSPFDDTME
jgi:hypothetical protein